MTRRPPPLSEEEMLQAEARFPELAAKAGAAAHARALKLRGFVLMSRDDRLVEVHADGSERFIRDLPPSLAVTPGQILYKRKSAVDPGA